MRLQAPCSSINFITQDIYGETIHLESFRGRSVMLCFFRDAACPFCNLRIYELTNNYQEWQSAGLEIVVVFSSTAEEVREHVARYPRPFRMIADPDLTLYNHYGVEHSSPALAKAFLFNLPRIIRGIAAGGRPSRNPHVKLVPADFLIDSDGQVVDAWYGRNTADHIPMSHIKQFLREAKKLAFERERIELSRLRAENQQLRQLLHRLKGQAKLGTRSVAKA